MTAFENLYYLMAPKVTLTFGSPIGLGPSSIHNMAQPAARSCGGPKRLHDEKVEPTTLKRPSEAWKDHHTTKDHEGWGPKSAPRWSPRIEGILHQLRLKEDLLSPYRPEETAARPCGGQEHLLQRPVQEHRGLQQRPVQGHRRPLTKPTYLPIARLEACSAKANLYRERGQKDGLFNESGHKSGLFNKSSQNKSLFNESGKESGLFNESGQKESLFNESGQKKSLFNKSGKESDLFNESGQKESLFNKSGKENGLFNESGQRKGLFNESGQKKSLFHKSGQKNGLFNESNQKNGLFNKSGQRDGKGTEDFLFRGRGKGHSSAQSPVGGLSRKGCTLAHLVPPSGLKQEWERPLTGGVPSALTPGQATTIWRPRRG